MTVHRGTSHEYKNHVLTQNWCIHPDHDSYICKHVQTYLDKNSFSVSNVEVQLNKQLKNCNSSAPVQP